MRNMVWRLNSRICAALALLLAPGIGVLGFAPSIAHAESGTSYWRIIHAAAAVPAADVYVDSGSTPIVSNFTFGQVTQYVPVTAGTHTVTITPAGQPLSHAFITSTVTVNPGTSYTLAAVGDSQNPPGLAVFTDDNTIASGMSKVRVYHLSGDAGLAGVQANGQTVIPAIGYEKASDYLTVQPGSYTFHLLLQNGMQASDFTTTLEPNKVTSIIAVGLVKGTGNNVVERQLDLPVATITSSALVAWSGDARSRASFASCCASWAR